MPSYDYRCTTCQHVTTVTKAVTDDTVPACAECGAPTNRIYTAPAISFKGTGWGGDHRNGQTK